MARPVTATDARSRVLHAALAPVDVAWLAALRIALGTLLCVSMLRFLVYGWVARLFVEPSFHFTYWGFSWVAPLPSAWMHALFVGLAVLALCVALGLWFRVTCALLALGLSYVQLIDVSTYLNHYYLAALLLWLLACTPAQRAWSLDARRARAAGRPLPATVPAGVLWLFRFQIGVVYVGAALAKAQGDWLLHGQPLGIWLGQRTELPLLGSLFTLPHAPLVMSWGGFLFDLTIPLWLSWRRTRPYAYVAVVAFHAVTRALLPIGMFPFIMSAAALVFFDPDWPRRLLRGGEGAKRAAAPAPSSAVSWKARSALALGLVYSAVQLALPLRHLAYGGNVLWHEQGLRFAWHVMVRAKGGQVELEVRDPRTGALRGVVPPRAYLTGLQEQEMASQPDLILQLAHHVRRDLEARGEGPVEVHAVTRVSLNGRRGRPLVDPDVDLAAVRDGIARADWILPAPTDPPPPTRPVR